MNRPDLLCSGPHHLTVEDWRIFRRFTMSHCATIEVCDARDANINLEMETICYGPGSLHRMRAGFGFTGEEYREAFL